MTRHLIAAALSMLLCIQSLAAANTRTVKGTVLDEEGEPLIGVWVEVEGIKGGTATDIEGQFSISVPAGVQNVLKFTYLGYDVTKVTVTPDQNVVNITLKQSQNLIDEVVVTAYGLVQKRSDMTGSAFQVNSEKLANLPAARVENLLDGMVPGLVTTESSTGARSRYSIRIRGDASLSANSEPLWIIDGVPVYTGSKTQSVTGTSYNVYPLSYVNPDDIESITVLKDAATTSIYGADGSNGVILVTTKQGLADGATHVRASLRYGLSQLDPETKLKRLNAAQWWELAKTSWTNAGYDLANFPYQDNEHNSYSTTDTDWYDVYFGLGQSTDLNISIDSGNSKSKNYISVSYNDEKSTIMGNRQQRVSLRDKATFKFNEKLSLDFNLAMTYNINDLVSVSSTYLNVIPIFSPYDEDGVTPRLYNWYSRATDSYVEKQYKFIYSEVAQREFSDNQQRCLTADGNAILRYKILPCLNVSANFGVNSINIFELIYDPKTTLDGLTDSSEQDGYSHRAGVANLTWNSVEQLNFSKSFGNHKVGALLGTEFKSTENHSVSAYAYGFANDHIKEISYSAESSGRRGSSSASNSRSLSYFGQATYSYGDRYYLSASYRRQGFSAFSVYHRWGDYASVGLSWNVHNESFFKVPWINKLKVKASYGNTGNSRLDSSAAYGTYSYSSGSYYGGLMGATQSSAPNPGLSWESTNIANVGLDMAFLDNRIDLSMEFYDKYTKDMLYSGRVSSIITSGNVTRNVGEMENTGFELSLMTKNIVKPNFSWTTEFNGAVNRNTIRALYKDMHTGFFDYVWVAGASKDAWWLSRWAGIDPTTGAPMWYDQNGNLTYAFSYDNRVLLPEYDKQPDFRGGMRNTFRYKNFSLIIFLTYTLGGWGEYIKNEDGLDLISYNTIVEDLNYWQGPGSVSNNPAPVYKNSTNSTLGSTRFLYSTTNVQFKNIVLSYNVPAKFSKKLGLSGATASIILDNPYIWCPGQGRNNNSYKTMFSSYGITRTLSGQLQLNF